MTGRGRSRRPPSAMPEGPSAALTSGQECYRAHLLVPIPGGPCDGAVGPPPPVGAPVYRAGNAAAKADAAARLDGDRHLHPDRYAPIGKRRGPTRPDIRSER